MGNRILVLAAAALMFLAVPSVFGQTGSTGGNSPLALIADADTPQKPSTGQTPGNNKQLTVNPVTGQTTAYAATYTPLTADQRWKLYFKQSYWSVGAYVGPLFAALALDQATGTPKEWGGGFRGYGRRVASRVASGDVVQNSIQFPAAALLKEDVRYIAANEHGLGHRLGHAVLYSFLTYNSHGHTTLNVANVGGYYGAAAISTLWLPGHQKVASYTLSNGSESMALSVPVNMLQEFWPEVSRAVRHRWWNP